MIQITQSQVALNVMSYHPNTKEYSRQALFKIVGFIGKSGSVGGRWDKNQRVLVSRRRKNLGTEGLARST